MYLDPFKRELNNVMSAYGCAICYFGSPSQNAVVEGLIPSVNGRGKRQFMDNLALNIPMCLEFSYIEAVGSQQGKNHRYAVVYDNQVDKLYDYIYPTHTKQIWEGNNEENTLRIASICLTICFFRRLEIEACMISRCLSCQWVDICFLENIIVNFIVRNIWELSASSPISLTSRVFHRNCLNVFKSP